MRWCAAGTGLPIRLKPEDIEIHRTRNSPKCATVVLADMSGSMRYDGQYIHAATLAPAPASPRAMPSPIPPLPPVTIATLPARSNSFTFVSSSPRFRGREMPQGVALREWAPSHDRSEHRQPPRPR